MSNSKSFLDLKTSLGLIIAAFAFLLYAQTISYKYVNDDVGIIKTNTYVKSGISGIPKILKTDYWDGCKWDFHDALYRPASLVMFAIEWQFFPDNPQIGHFINVLLYAITCWLLFQLLFKIFDNKNLTIPFVCTLLFVAHPIHTEVVCNIKSRDEILCLLFGILSIFFLISYYSNKRLGYLILGSLFYFLSLLSKESGISFLLLIPLILYISKDINLKSMITVFSSLAGFTMIYLLIRYQVLLNVDYKDKILVLLGILWEEFKITIKEQNCYSKIFCFSVTSSSCF